MSLQSNTLAMATPTLEKVMKQWNREWIGIENTANRYFRDSPLNPSNYPPYNVLKCSDTTYQITIAMAGFSKDDVEITIENDLLNIVGTSPGMMDGFEDMFLHKGIATRDFKLRFSLAEHVKVADAKFLNGLLNISLTREIPEEDKPQVIEIT